MEDVPKRIVWVMEHIAEYGGDPSQLSIMGYLAGAHIVALVATDRRHLVEHDAELSRLSDVIILDNDVCSPDNPDRDSGLDPCSVHPRSIGEVGTRSLLGPTSRPARGAR